MEKLVVNGLTQILTNVPLKEKPSGWFLLAKCVTKTCEIVKFETKYSRMDQVKLVEDSL